jgi:hypothetical protein
VAVVYSCWVAKYTSTSEMISGSAEFNVLMFNINASVRPLIFQQCDLPSLVQSLRSNTCKFRRCIN